MNKTKICTTCKFPLPISDFYYHRVRKHRMATCKSCNSEKTVKYYKEVYQSNINYVMYQRAYGINRDKGNKVKIMPNLKEHLLELWDKQNQICFYTGEKMNINGYKNNPLAMTVDRKNCKKGYIKGNIVLCTSIVNRIKQNLSVDELLNLCDKIKTHLKNK